MDVDVPSARQQVRHLGWGKGSLAVHPAGQRAIECQRHASGGSYRSGTMKVARNGIASQPPVRQLPAQQPGGFVKYGINLPGTPSGGSAQRWHLVRACEHGAESGQTGGRLLRRCLGALASALSARLGGVLWGAARAKHHCHSSSSREPYCPDVQRYTGWGRAMQHAGLRVATAAAKTVAKSMPKPVTMAVSRPFLF